MPPRVPRSPNDHLGVIDFYFFSEFISWALHQLMSPGGGVSASRPLQGSARTSGSWNFFSSLFITLLYMHPLMGAELSLCVAFEAWIHAFEGT
jgi:hypothetical protein